MGPFVEIAVHRDHRLADRQHHLLQQRHAVSCNGIVAMHEAAHAVIEALPARRVPVRSEAIRAFPAPVIGAAA
jgi:hypothetical protein